MKWPIVVKALLVAAVALAGVACAPELEKLRGLVCPAVEPAAEAPAALPGQTGLFDW